MCVQEAVGKQEEGAKLISELSATSEKLKEKKNSKIRERIDDLTNSAIADWNNALESAATVVRKYNHAAETWTALRAMYDQTNKWCDTVLNDAASLKESSPVGFFCFT